MIKSFTWFLSCLLCLSGSLAASSVLISYHAGNHPTQSPVPWVTVGSSTNVISGSYLDGTRTVWRLEDPGVISGTNGKSAGLYYEKLFSVDQRNDLHAQGWNLSTTLKIPSSDPSAGSSWNADSSVWVGYGYNFPVASGAPLHRAVFAFMFGRAANGTTNVQVYGAGTPGLLNVSGDYHDYSIKFNPLTQKASFYVDDDLLIEYGGSVTTGTGDSRLYWGDNSNQGTAGPHRVAYYESIVFSMVPEPSRLALAALAIGTLLLRRRR